MTGKWATYGLIAELLDSLGIGACLFDDDDRSVLWNRTFLKLFPEHDGHVHEGEHYSANLRRFYLTRLGADELPHIEKYIADGIERHHTQSRPFVFSHRGRWVRVASTPLPEGGRIRIWTPIARPGAGDATPVESHAGDLALMENIADGVLLRNADGTISAVNEQFLVLYGIATKEKVVGRLFEEVLRDLAPRHDEEASAQWARKLAEDQRFSGAPFELPLPNGRWIRVTEQQSPDGTVYSTHVDITAIKREQRAMVAAKDAADRANVVKSQFLAMISHEIRTPLNGIIGMTDLLLNTDLSSQQRRYAETTYNSADRLLGIINDVLDVSKLEAGKIRLESIGFDLSELVGEVTALIEPRARERGLDFVLQIDPQLSGRFLGDPTRVRQVLLNLLSNAVKFTEAGKVELLLGPSPVEPRTIRIEVRDTGVGIPDGDHDKLFNKFEQADETISRRFGGTGLGLNISKQLVELMGGRIGAASRFGGGSVFWFTLPVRRDLGVTPLPGPAVAARVSHSGRVLLVEDNPVNQEVARAILMRAGFTVITAPTGEEAVMAVQAEVPDVVLMDIQLPGIDGYETTQRIRALGAELDQVPIIALTAYAMEGDRDSCLARGMNDYLSKPFDATVLVRTVADWAEQSRKDRERA